MRECKLDTLWALTKQEVGQAALLEITILQAKTSLVQHSDQGTVLDQGSWDPAFFLEADAWLGEVEDWLSLGKSPIRRFHDLEVVTPFSCLSTG